MRKVFKVRVVSGNIGRNLQAIWVMYPEGYSPGYVLRNFRESEYTPKILRNSEVYQKHKRL